MQRYRRVHSLTSLWFSSLICFFELSNTLKLNELELGLGHFKENELYPEYAIIGSEISMGVPQSHIFYHYIRRVEKYTFDMYSNTSFFRWNVLEAFINEFLPEMDVYRESKIGYQRKKITYRKRGRCLEFVRCRDLKTQRSTWRRNPYPFTLTLRYIGGQKFFLKHAEAYFRMMRLPFQIHGKINQWWLARRWWLPNNFD